MDCINHFERWSKHDDMNQYKMVLEEWDEIVGDFWTPPGETYLNPLTFRWID